MKMKGVMLMLNVMSFEFIKGEYKREIALERPVLHGMIANVYLCYYIKLSSR